MKNSKEQAGQPKLKALVIMVIMIYFEKKLLYHSFYFVLYWLSVTQCHIALSDHYRAIMTTLKYQPISIDPAQQCLQRKFSGPIPSFKLYFPNQTEDEKSDKIHSLATWDNRAWLSSQAPFKTGTARFYRPLNPLTAGAVHIRFFTFFYQHITYQLLNLLKINQHDLKFVDLHFVKSE